MSATTAADLPAVWPRATAVLLVTLLAHAWVLGRLQRMFDETPTPEAPLAPTVTARLLPPMLVAPSPPPRPTVSTPRAPRVPSAPAMPIVAAPTPPPAVEPLPAQGVEALPVPSAEAPPVASVEAPATTPATDETPLEERPASTVTQNAERPVESQAAIDAAEFDASGPALRAALAGPTALSSALPATARYVYRTTYSELRLASGTTTLDWSLAGERYRLRMTTSTLGTTLVELDSQGSLREFGLAPDRYVETRIRRGAAAANFDWSARRVTFSARTHEQALPDGVQDRISFQFQLMLLGQAVPERFRPGRLTVLRIASRDDVSDYRLRSAGRDTTVTGLGELDTVKVERLVEKEADARIEIWLAPDQGWLPARLRFTDRHGRVTESILESIATP